MNTKHGARSEGLGWMRAPQNPITFRTLRLTYKTAQWQRQERTYPLPSHYHARMYLAIYRRRDRWEGPRWSGKLLERRAPVAANVCSFLWTLPPGSDKMSALNWFNFTTTSTSISSTRSTPSPALWRVRQPMGATTVSSACSNGGSFGIPRSASSAILVAR